MSTKFNIKRFICIISILFFFIESSSFAKKYNKKKYSSESSSNESSFSKGYEEGKREEREEKEELEKKDEEIKKLEHEVENEDYINKQEHLNPNTPNQHTYHHVMLDRDEEDWEPNKHYVTVGPGIGIVNNYFGYGASGGFLFSVSKEFLVGAEIGYYYYTYTIPGTLITDTFSSIPLLATAMIRIPFGDSSVVSPYIGGSIGVSVTPYGIQIAGYTYPQPFGGLTMYYFMGLVKPGIEISIASNSILYIETKLGYGFGNFLFLPSVGVGFSI